MEDSQMLMDSLEVRMTKIMEWMARMEAEMVVLQAFMVTNQQKKETSESIELPDDDAQNSKPVGGVKTINNIIT